MSDGAVRKKEALFAWGIRGGSRRNRAGEQSWRKGVTWADEIGWGLRTGISGCTCMGTRNVRDFSRGPSRAKKRVGGRYIKW